MQSEFLLDHQMAKHQGSPDHEARSLASSESAASLSNSSAASDSPEDSSNPELMKSRYMPKVPEDHEVEAEGYHTWEIENWKDLKAHKVPGPRFKVGEYEWNLLLFPKGNGGNYLSVYLEPHPPSTIIDSEGDAELVDITDGASTETTPAVADAAAAASNPDDKENINADDTVLKEVPIDPSWHVCSQFVIDIWNPKHPEVHKQNVSQHRFSSDETDWGFSNFIELSNLHSTSRQFKRPFVDDNKVNFTVYVRIVKDHTGVLWHNFLNYDSKKETGFVGINNQGATCYLNSLLQSYYFTKLFRKKVYQIPTQDELVNLDDGEKVAPMTKSVSLALQRLFYRLQSSDQALDTNELTASFGWDSSEAFTQHDVQEMNRILMDRLENKMRGTEIEGCLSSIFVGKMKSFIRCINVDYESSRTEDFWDIQLNVKGMKDLKESFANYIELETLTGENQYDASGFGHQDAEKGVVFESFPPVLHLQLKRFEYDFSYDQLIKVNDRHEFMNSIDLKPYLDPSSSITSEDWTYDLHGVLVHTGDISTGHYYALIKPSDKDEWFRFDDDRVWRVTPNDVFEENFGCDKKGEVEIRSMTRAEQFAYQNRRHTSAYMLVYIRRAKIPEILDEVEDSDIPQHIPAQVIKEEEEEIRLRKEREEMHLYANFKLITNKTFMHYQGFDLTPDETSKLYYANDIYEDDAYPITFKLLKSLPAKDLFEAISEALGGVDYHHFRLWSVINRKNSTSRPDTPIDLDVDQLDDITIEDVIEQRGSRKSDVFTLFAEELNKGLKFISKSVIEAARDNDPKFDVKVLSKEPDITSATLLDHFEKISSSIPPEKYPPFAEIDVDSQELLVLLKYYDPEAPKLIGVTHAVVNRDSYTGSLAKYIQVLMNWSFDTEVVLYEEIQPNSIELIDNSSTFAKSELQNGDVICFAKASFEKSFELEFPSIPSYYKFLRHRVHLFIRPLQKIDEDTEEFADNGVDKNEHLTNAEQKELDLWVVSSISFKDLAVKVANEINVDPDYIRIFGVYSNDNRLPITSHTHLQQLLTKNVPQSSLFNFEYEILNITVQELENMKALKIFWLSSGVVHYQKHELLIPKNGTVKDLIDKIASKFKLDAAAREGVFIYTTMNNRISHVLSPEMSISPMDSSRYMIYGGIYPELYAALSSSTKSESARLEIIKNSIDPNIISSISFPTSIADIRTTYTFQFLKDFNSRHGIPFVFIMIKGEKFKYTKLRLQQKIGLGAKEFTKVKIAISPAYGEWKPRYIEDDDAEIFDELDVEDHLALDHPDRTARRTSNFERAIFIKD